MFLCNSHNFKTLVSSKNILVAPLNWGLGHATRCIPIIHKLIEFGYTPILASDGDALGLLKTEFPNLIALELPSYHIKYAKKGQFFKWKIVLNTPKMLEAITKEKKLVKRWVKEYELIGIISDNRFGVVSKRVPSIFITHQLNVLSGNTTYLTTKIHRNWIKKFTECWVPDFKKEPNLSGKLGHLKKSKLKIKYLGALSRFEKKELEQRYDLAVILSGPEPQRSLLEEIINQELKRFDGKVIFVKGKIQSEKKSETNGTITSCNFMNAQELEQVINQSKLVLSRSGYTTIMDLVKLQKKAFFIPTPGQTEQEYLAKRLKKQGIAPYSSQGKFKIEMLNHTMVYKGFESIEFHTHWDYLFRIFVKER